MTNKTVAIGDLKFNNVAYYKKKEISRNNKSRGNIFKYREEYKVASSNCDRMVARVEEATNGWYFYNTMLEDMMERHNNNCKVEKVANINFSICTSKKTITTDNGKESTRDAFYYNASTSIANQSGYGSKTLIELDTKKCYVEVRDHFKKSLALKSK